MLAAEIVLIVSMVFQGAIIFLPGRRRMFLSSELIFTVALMCSALAALGLFTFGNFLPNIAMLSDHSLFRLPRATLLLSAILLGRIVASTKELPANRKPEVLFLLTVIVLLCDVLLLSRHLTLSVLLLLMISWACIFLGGLSYRGRLEGEAILKFWLQASLGLVIGLGALVILTLVAGGVHYDQLAAFAKTMDQYSIQSLFLIHSLFLPFILAMGLFPFHFVILDRDHGVTWAVQGIMGVLVQGSIALALWKMGAEIFGHSHGVDPSDGMKALQYCGIAGGYALLIFALSQENAKRLLAAILGASWSIILAAGAMPSAQSASAVAYSFAAVFLWGALLSFIWSRMQESAHDGSISAVFGLGKKFRASGLILLVALAGPLCVPGFPGFPSALHLLGAIIEQKALALLVMEVILLVLLCFTAAKLASDLLFRDGSITVIEADSVLVRYSKIDILSLATIIGAMLLLGLFWNQVFAILLESAKAFL